MYVPSAGKTPKEGKKPAGDNALDAIRKDLERLKDESIKKNRDNLDALYNIDMRNMSESMKRLFAKMGKAVASVETLATDVEAAVNIVAQYGENLAAVQLKADQNSASINNIVKWQSEVDSSIQSTAQIQQTVRENEARISLLVNASGDGLTSSGAGIIAQAIAGEDSLIQLIADKVEIQGTAEFVTRDELADNSGSTTISGNHISVLLSGNNDSVDTVSNAGLSFTHAVRMYEDEMGRIQTVISGTDSNVSTKYKLVMETKPIRDRNGNESIYPAIKLNAAGRLSLESSGEAVYVSSLGGYCLLDATSNTRIRANATYESANILDTAASNDYVFASDGIYYNGRKIVST